MVVGWAMRYTIPQRILLEADEERRKAERKAQTTGSVKDRANALFQRVRQGEIDPQRLQTAAGLGDEECQEVVRLLGMDPVNYLVDQNGRLDWAPIFLNSGLATEELFNFVCKLVLKSDLVRNSDLIRLFVDVSRGNLSGTSKYFSEMAEPSDEPDDIILIHLYDIASGEQPNNVLDNLDAIMTYLFYNNGLSHPISYQDQIVAEFIALLKR